MILDVWEELRIKLLGMTGQDWKDSIGFDQEKIKEVIAKVKAHAWTITYCNTHAIMFIKMPKTTKASNIESKEEECSTPDTTDLVLSLGFLRTA